MLDSYNRTIDYLRISITDRCNLRCVYCMPERGVANIEHQNVLTYEEILRICRIGAQLGISKLKITGGEPLLRRGAVEFISAAKQVPGIRQVTLTTNGLLLADYVNELLQAKVDGINISLDTLDGAAYREITRWGELNLVQNSIETAYTHGIRPIKINCVLIRGVNEQQAVPLAAMAAKRQISVRFIEMMPVGLGRQYQAVSGDEVLQLLAAAYGQPQPCGEKLGNGPAVYYTFPALCGKIGIIDAVSHKFCASCNRLRLTADGSLKLCLNYDSGCDLRNLLRGGGNDAMISHAIATAIAAKPRQHSFGEANQLHTEAKNMNAIGG